MRQLVLVALSLTACGRWNFDAVNVDGGDTTGDGGLPASVFTQLADDIAVAPSAPGTLYAAAGGRVFRSTDRGASWTACAATSQMTWLVAVEPNDANTVYAGETPGLERSTDGCATWTSLSPLWISALLVGRGDVLVGSSGIYRLRAGTWSQLASPLDGHQIASFELAADGTIYASSTDSGVVRSVNDGASFSSINTGLTDLNIQDLALVDPANNASLVAQTATGVVTTTNGGAAWTPSSGAGDGRDAIAVDPTDSTFAVGNTWRGMIRSYTSGTSFDGSNPRSAALSAGWSNTFAFDPSMPGRVYVANERGVFVADDHNLQWYGASSGLDAWVIRQITEVPGTNAILAATSSGVARSDDDGATWTVEATGMEIGDSRLNTIFVPPTNPAMTLSGGTSWLWTSTNGARTFGVLATVNATDHYSVNTISSEWPRVWFGTGSRLWHSDDGGTIWYQGQMAGADHWTNDILGANGDIWVATDDGVFHTMNDGVSWQLVSNVKVNAGASSLARASDGTVLVGTKDGVYGIDPGATTWTSRGLTGITIRDVAVAGARWIAAADTGVFVSTDGGTTWTELPGLARRRPRSLLVRANGQLLVGTNGYGLFRTTL